MVRTDSGRSALRRLALSSAASATLLVALGAVHGQTAPIDSSDLRARFLAPPADAGPWRAEGFPGGDINLAKAQAEWSADKTEGAGGLSVGFGAPSFGARLSPEAWAKVNDFATPAYFQRFAGALGVAQRLGLPVESTFGSCWPSGGGFAITPELAAVEMTLSVQQVEGGASDPKLTLPQQPGRFGSFLRMFGPPPPGQELPAGWADRLKARTHVVAVLAVKGTAPDALPMNRAILSPADRWGTVIRSGQLDPSSTIDLTTKFDANGQLHWTAPAGTWQVFVFRQVPSDMQISCGAGAGPQLVADTFNHAAFDAHAKRVFSDGIPALKPYFGNALHGYSVDSSEYISDIFWTDAFQADFKRRRGYDLTPYLPFVFQPGWMAHPHQARFSRPMFDAANIGPRILSDYRLTVAELMTENFYAPFADLMHKNGLIANIQAHGAPVDTLKVYGLADVPEVEDLHVGPDPYFLRLGRAAADIYGHKIVSSESLIWDSGGPSITPQMMKQHIDAFFLAGVNRIRFGGIGGQPAPKPGQRPSPVAGLGAWIGRDLSTWPFMLDLSQYIQRTQAVLQQGTHVVPLAVFKPDPTYMPASATDEPKTEPTPAFIAGLVPAGYDYDQISDDGIQKGKVVGRRLVTPGGASFSALILPATKSLRLETAAAIRRFAAAGLPVLFEGATPTRYSGFANRAVADAQVRRDMQAALGAGARVVRDGRFVYALAGARVEGNLQPLDGSNFTFFEKAIGRDRVFLIHNPSDTAQRAGFSTRAEGGAELWDAWSGTARPLPTEVAGDRRRVAFDLAPLQTIMVVFSPSSKVVAMPADDTVRSQQERPSPVIELGNAGWTLHATGKGAGDRPIDVTLKLSALTDWTTTEQLRALSGQGSYTTTLAIDPAWLKPGRALRLDLGVLGDYARLTVNGQRVAVPVDGPFVADVTRVLKPGDNTVVIDVFNLPSNAYAASAPGAYGLRPSGLTGPVWLKMAPAEDAK